MEYVSQNLTPEFREYLAQIYNPDGTRQHDKVIGQCKCGAVHKADEFTRDAVIKFQKMNQVSG